MGPGLLALIVFIVLIIVWAVVLKRNIVEGRPDQHDHPALLRRNGSGPRAAGWQPGVCIKL